ncbi:M55 family metallopeptidase [Candidatus Bathyarchaeota archaeon]|nr:M55 family metallopeptidase [Candidatus Bathyarchaeota archaeon]MBS7631788.1 M55 family metallopeptidase [Candidatus Bathyarchaeota archaeon]
MSKPKKIFISIDMEGASGIVDWSQVGRDPQEYQTGRKLMVGDLNAAIEGALEAGVEEVVVSDAHGGMRNLQPEDVHEAAYLIRGSPKPLSMMEGISDEFDAALYVAYHSMNGTRNGILCHTISSSVVDAVYINGKETGEFGLNAALAGFFRVPSIFISGDVAVADEARCFVPQIHTAVVKWGVGRYAAKCLHPSRARALIKKTVKESLEDFEKIKPYEVESPVEVKLRFQTSTQADIASVLPYLERIDGKTVRGVFNNYFQAMKGLRAAISIGGTAEIR